MTALIGEQAPVTNNSMSTDPQATEGFLFDPAVAQREALESVADYSDVYVVRRKSLKKPEETEWGMVYHETVRYSDNAVRPATLYVPDVVRSPHVLATGDPWCTGDVGHNDTYNQKLARQGFVVVANHHQGPHALLPLTKEHIRTTLTTPFHKSLGRAAAQEHALLDDLADHGDFSTDEILSDGYSRRHMIGEALIAIAAKRPERRDVVWSDHQAGCFAEKESLFGFLVSVGQQLPSEIKAIAEIGQQLLDEKALPAAYHPLSLNSYKGTMSLHWHNVLQELTWLGPLISGDAGRYARAMPLDTRGVRTTYNKDVSSQQFAWDAIYSQLPSIISLHRDGGHLAGASPRRMHERVDRWRRVADYSQLHEGDLSEMSPEDVLPITRSRLRAAS